MIKRLVAVLLVAGIVLVPASSGAWPPNVKWTKAYIASRAGNVSFSVIGPRGVAYSYHAYHQVHSASTLKVMFMVAYLRRASVRNRELHRSDKRLLGPMIRRSDNVAATRVDNILGPRPMYRLARDAGMRHFHFVSHPWGNSLVTAGDMARLMFRLEDFIPDRHVAYARYLLAHIIPSQRWGIGRLDHPYWKFFFKGGWGSGTGSVDHQVAFLDRDGLRVAAAVMTTSSPSHAYGKATLYGAFRRLLRHLPKPRS